MEFIVNKKYNFSNNWKDWIRNQPLKWVHKFWEKTLYFTETMEWEFIYEIF